ncbi:hypothetical protein J1605_007724 [Eschrichtius robustus]|uniref:Glypican-6 n=1 Tax=Eschrichtius robustus TaxID=9764 RepID=A0AB34H0B2_ESCRO|nr:hypothetical protein J1605_007724 [Eschrichtius robustus]
MGYGERSEAVILSELWWCGLEFHLRGIQEYQDGVPKIPTACITVEDAEMMSRMASRGSRIVIQLKMGAKNYPDADSFNTVAEIIGSKYPEQVQVCECPRIAERVPVTFPGGKHLKALGRKGEIPGAAEEFGSNGTEQTRTENLVTMERLMRAIRRQYEISKKGKG